MTEEKKIEPRLDTALVDAADAQFRDEKARQAMRAEMRRYQAYRDSAAGRLAREIIALEQSLEALRALQVELRRAFDETPVLG